MRTGSDLTQWGYKDYTRLAPILAMTLDNFEQAVYNMMFHLKQQRSEVLSWPWSVQQTVWTKHLHQLELENEPERA